MAISRVVCLGWQALMEGWALVAARVLARVSVAMRALVVERMQASGAVALRERERMAVPRAREREKVMVRERERRADLLLAKQALELVVTPVSVVAFLAVYLAAPVLMEASRGVLVPTEASQGVLAQMEASREALVQTEAHPAKQMPAWAEMPQDPPLARLDWVAPSVVASLEAWKAALAAMRAPTARSQVGRERVLEVMQESAAQQVSAVQQASAVQRDSEAQQVWEVPQAARLEAQHQVKEA